MKDRELRAIYYKLAVLTVRDLPKMLPNNFACLTCPLVVWNKGYDAKNEDNDQSVTHIFTNDGFLCRFFHGSEFINGYNNYYLR